MTLTLREAIRQQAERAAQLIAERNERGAGIYPTEADAIWIDGGLEAELASLDRAIAWHSSLAAAKSALRLSQSVAGLHQLVEPPSAPPDKF